VIFVSVGTNEAPFDRLLEAVASLRLDEEVVVQHGHSARLGPPGARLVDFLSFEEMVDHIRDARVVVTHAGVGSAMVSLANGKRPVVVPRRRSFAEAVDDHQLQLGRRLAQAGLVTFAEQPAGLAAAIARHDGRATLVPATNSLAADISTFLSARLTRTATGRS
jgi:UDP-N-acetylglucosamine transferase subunit ALG13